jgi:chromosome segregation ATPase
MEVLGRMQADARAMEAHVASLERECSVLQSTLDRETQRDARIADEIAELDRECGAARLQQAATARRFDALKLEASSVEQALANEQRQVSTAHAFLGGAIERVTRLDYKLRFSAGPISWTGR